MASAADGFNPARDNLKELRRFQELLVGRFDTTEAVVIMERFKYNAKAAFNFVMEATRDEILELIKDEKASLDLTNKIQDLKISGSLLDDARHGRINSTVRLFACEPCDRSWWLRTPERKQVSKCHRCLVRYDPVPREQEWGWAQFECPNCAHKFSGHCEMRNTSPCYVCKTEVAPSHIQPPFRRRSRRSTNAHRCDAPDCGDCSQQPGGAARVPQPSTRRRVKTSPLPKDGSTVGDLRNTDPGDAGDYDLSQAHNVEETSKPPLPVTCVYPSTRRAQGKRRVVVPSRPHDSSGSTVDTFLTQADFDGRSDVSSRMSPINEN